MQLKSFIAGAIVGIVLTVSTIQFFNWSDPKPDREQTATRSLTNGEAERRPGANPAEVTSQDREGNIGATTERQGAPSQHESTPRQPDQSDHFGDEAETYARDTGYERTEQLADQSQGIEADSTARQSMESSPIPVTEAHQELLDKTKGPDPEMTSRGNTHEELENERTDHEWSYFMEQSIGQFLATHSEIAHFDIAGIACRTTLCEIQSFGIDENAVPRWSLIVNDLRNQQWNDFAQSGATADMIDGRLVIVTHLRRQTEQ